jgi:hypothetical protein
MDALSHTRDHRLVRRLGVLAMAVFQLTGAVALPAADGVLDMDRYGTPAHVESGGSDDCAPHHDHAFCQVVRATALANPSRAVSSVGVGDLVHQLHPLGGSAEVDITSPVLEGSSGPRAPPSA